MEPASRIQSTLLKNMYLAQTGKNVRIKTQGGQVISIHSCVLGAASATFSSHIEDKEKQRAKFGIFGFQTKNIAFDTWDCILQALYLGKVDYNAALIDDVIRDTQYLNMVDLHAQFVELKRKREEENNQIVISDDEDEPDVVIVSTESDCTSVSVDKVLCGPQPMDWASTIIILDDQDSCEECANSGQKSATSSKSSSDSDNAASEVAPCSQHWDIDNVDGGKQADTAIGTTPAVSHDVNDNVTNTGGEAMCTVSKYVQTDLLVSDSDDDDEPVQDDLTVGSAGIGSATIGSVTNGSPSMVGSPAVIASPAIITSPASDKTGGKQNKEPVAIATPAADQSVPDAENDNHMMASPSSMEIHHHGNDDDINTSLISPISEQDTLTMIEEAVANVYEAENQTAAARNTDDCARDDLKIGIDEYGVKICNICRKSYSNVSKLAHHLSDVHMKATPYICSFCKHEFESMRKLRVHFNSKCIDIYNQLKAYSPEKRQKRPKWTRIPNSSRYAEDFVRLSCHQCRFEAVNFNDLIVHLADRHQERYFKCKICAFNCKSLKKLKSHVMRKRSHMAMAEKGSRL